MKDRLFYIAKEEEIKKGKTTDIYFIRTVDILRKEGFDDIKVWAEITTSGLPYNFTWGVLAGTREVINLFKNVDATLYLMREGTIFKPYDDYGVRVPIGYIVGKYTSFAIYETPLLGLLSQATGVATYAAHLRYHARDKILLAFGARRMHPAISPMIDYAAYIAGFDGVSSVLSAEILGIKPMGTMPHSLIILFGDQRDAWRAFDRHVDEDVPRIALIDTFADEKIEAILATETLGKKLHGVRLDTPGSRRGDIGAIIREIRWELDLRGYNHVKIFLSGGVDIDTVKKLSKYPIDGYGIGASLSNAKIVDFSLDIVEVEDTPLSKRGKYSGAKQVYRCIDCYKYIVKPINEALERCPSCGGEMESLISNVSEGDETYDNEDINALRKYVKTQLNKIWQLGWGD